MNTVYNYLRKEPQYLPTILTITDGEPAEDSYEEYLGRAVGGGGLEDWTVGDEEGKVVVYGGAVVSASTVEKELIDYFENLSGSMAELESMAEVAADVEDVSIARYVEE